MNHNWSAMKQRLHLQIVAEISCHSVLSGDRIRQCETSSGSRHKHRSVSVSRHFLLQAPQCPCSVQKWFSRDHCCRERSKPGCRIVGSHTRWELTTWADFQLCLHRLLMSAGCKSSQSGFLDDKVTWQLVFWYAFIRQWCCHLLTSLHLLSIWYLIIYIIYIIKYIINQ